jgi:imidazolonepropionase-like amidohydrolase
LPWQVERPAPRQIESPLIALVGATIMTATGRIIENGLLLMEDGLIRAVGSRDEIEVPEGAEVVDVSGRYVTPGLIDAHSHMGVYPVPSVSAHEDGNEATSPVTAHVRASDSFWPQDPALARALAAGITTILVLPGSANLIGGAGETFKLHLGRSASEMEFPGAPDTIKMACGENPKRVHGEQHREPSTRMGNVAGYRRAFQEALEYGRQWADWRENYRLWAIRRQRWEEFQSTCGGGDGTAAGDTEGPRGGGAEGSDARGDACRPAGVADDAEPEPEDPGPAPAPPVRDYGKELLLGAIEGRVLVQVHCYRADEMVRMIEVSHEFGFRVRSFHHAVEAYKIRDLLAAEQIAVSTWADWWGFKLEAFDAIPENLALLTEAGVRGVLHSDSPMLVQRLNQEAAKAMTAGRAGGIDISQDEALRWITVHAAWALGIDTMTGSLEPGKMADVVVWSGNPFSIYSHVERVYIDGILEYDRARDASSRPSDFELGLDLEPPTLIRSPVAPLGQARPSARGGAR